MLFLTDWMRIFQMELLQGECLRILAMLEEVMEFIPGPDFPTGATICGRAEIVKAYSTGRGNLRVRSKVEQEVVHKRDALVVKEIPYQVNKANLVEKIHNLMKEGVLSEIAEWVATSAGWPSVSTKQGLPESPLSSFASSSVVEPKLLY